LINDDHYLARDLGGSRHLSTLVAIAARRGAAPDSMLACASYKRADIEHRPRQLVLGQHHPRLRDRFRGI
jgi:hypothetical protein